jgi:predicted NUDIX family phosphoesterase
MHNNQNTEKVMVVPTNLLYEVGYFEGISTDYSRLLNTISNNYIFKDRSGVESDSNYKQIIVYALINYKNSILRYKRGKKITESRLKNKLSIGLGGHVTKYDISAGQDPFITCLYRELSEEIHINTKLDHRFVAILNDDSNPVGAVHLGIITVIDLKQPNVKPKEKSIMECKFINKKDLRNNLQNYEKWSQICIENIDALLHD